MAEFIDQLRVRWQEAGPLCVGLDAEYTKIPPHIVEDQRISWRRYYHHPGNPNLRYDVQLEFLIEVIDQTADFVCAFKPNIAFFEGTFQGERVLRMAVQHIHKCHPGIPVIGDTKRADIGNTNRNYAALFDRYGFDAMTTSPYLGPSTYQALLDGHPGKGLIVLCKTTNPDAAIYQDAPISVSLYAHIQEKNGTPLTDEEYEKAKMAAEIMELEYEEQVSQDAPDFIPLYQMVAIRTATLARENPNIGLVVGATHPESFAPIRRLVGNTYFLIPGIGSQGGDVETTLKYAPDSQGQGMIINNGSKILFASSGRDFAEAARAEALRNFEQFRAARAA